MSRIPVALAVCTTLFWGSFVVGEIVRVPEQHPSIQAAIDTANSGDTVEVSAGTYHERLRLRKGVTLRSAGNDRKGKMGLQRAEATIIDGRFDGATGPGVLMAEDSTIDGFTVTGVGTYDEELWKRHYATYGEEQDEEPIGEPGAAGISVSGVERCTVRNNIVHHIGYTGIAIVGDTSRRVAPHINRNVCYRNMGGGIGSMKKSTAIIEANTCVENFYAGIGHDDASPLVIDNECYANLRAGIGVSDGASPVVRNNRCYKNRRAGIGVRTGEETQPIIEHNECFDNEMAGIGNRDEARPIIRHNKCYRNRMSGIGSRDHASAVIEYNECYDNDMSGIGARLGATPVIRHNKCFRNRMAGIGAREGATPVIDNNECFENEMTGIGSQENAAPIIRGNRCHHNSMAGIGSRLGSRPVIVDNECFENLMTGIGSREGAAPVIRDNNCHDNLMAGIGSRLGARPVIVDNLSQENHKAGIGVRDAATVAVLVGNRCLENRLVAIGLPDGATGVLHGNVLKRTGGGAPPLVAVKGGSQALVSHNSITGGGVAGVLVQGTVQVIGNHFHRKGPGQGSAVWVWKGSTVTVSDNRVDGYRNAVNATGSHVTVTGNITSRFSGASVVVQSPASPALVYDNTALSDDPQDAAADVEGDSLTTGNAIRKPTDVDHTAVRSPTKWPLLENRAGPSWHVDAGTGKQRSVEDGPWILIATYNTVPKYALFNTKADPQRKTDLAKKLEQVTFRLRGFIERQEAIEYQTQMQQGARRR